MKNSINLVSIVIAWLIIIAGVFIIFKDFNNDFMAINQNINQPINIPINNLNQPIQQKPVVIEIEKEKPTIIQLDVPYINETPDGNWTGPWKNACEEASMTMIENYYNNNQDVTIEEAKTFMTMLFNKQNELWGSNSDSDAVKTKKLIDDYTSYKATIITDPSIEQIKLQLQKNQPVISFHYGKLLNNPNIPFLATGSYYHVMVIIGYDDKTQEFIVNDDGDLKTGTAHHYDYQLFMNSLHDFDFSVKKANGPATVIFTSLK